MTSKVINAEASFDGNGGYKAEYVEWVSVDKMTNLKAKAEEMVGLGLSTPWKDITLLCSGSGATISQDTSDYEAKAVLALYDASGKDSRCPRTGHVGFTFNSNYSKPINYRLTSNTGIDKSGTVQLSKSGSQWKGLVTVPFPVNKYGKMGAVLRHIQNGVATIVATKTRDYKCIAPSVNTGSDDLVHGTIPFDPAIPPAKYDGKLTIADSVLVTGDKCPRQGQVVFTLNSNRSTPVSYSLIGTNGQSWTGTVQMLSKGGGKYQGVGVKPFNVLKTEKVTFVLKRLKDNKAYVLDFRARQFICKKSIVNTGSVDLKPDSNQPSNSSVDAQIKAKADAVKLRLKAAAAAKALKLRAAKSAAIAKRKRDAAKQAAAALQLRRMKALKAAAVKRTSAAALARRRAAAASVTRRKATIKKRAAPSRPRSSTTTRRRVIRRR